VIDVIEEENTATSAASPNAKFRIAAPGWEKLVVQLLAAENFVNVALATGTGNCP
jgi:hypothetical protein